MVDVSRGRGGAWPVPRVPSGPPCPRPLRMRLVCPDQALRHTHRACGSHVVPHGRDGEDVCLSFRELLGEPAAPAPLHTWKDWWHFCAPVTRVRGL